MSTYYHVDMFEYEDVFWLIERGGVNSFRNL